MRRISEIRARLEAATRGPWKTETALMPKTPAGVEYLGDGPSDVYQTHIVQEAPGMYGLHWPVVAAAVSPYYEPDTAVYIEPANAVLIASAPADLAFLVGEITRLRALALAALDALEPYSGWWSGNDAACEAVGDLAHAAEED